MYHRQLSEQAIISGFRKGDADIIREYFYGYCEAGYHYYDQKYQLSSKENLDFMSLAHQYAIYLMEHDWKPLEDHSPEISLKSWLICGFRYVVLDALKWYRREYGSITFEDYLRSFDVSDDLRLQFNRMVEDVCDHASLDRQERMIINMLLLRGFKGKEVAAELGMTPAAIITDTFDYSDIVRVLDLDEAFVFHQVQALQSKYWRIVIKTKPKGMKIFQPVMVSGNRGIDYLIYMLSRDWQVTKKQRMLDYMRFGVYRQSDGFHLVGFTYLDSNPMAKPEKVFFTPHFFDRYKERTGLPLDMPKMEVMKDWIMKNQHLNSDAQGSEKYPDGIFCAYPSGVALGRELPDGNSEMKTFITYNMLRGEQVEKGESQSKAAKVQEEEGFQVYKDIVEKLLKNRRLWEI